VSKKELKESRMKTTMKEMNSKKIGSGGRNNYFEQVFTYSSDGILLTDVEGYIMDVNKSIEEMLGYAKNELEGRHMSGLLPHELKKRDFTPQLIEHLKNKKKKTTTVEYKWLRKDGQPVFVELHIALLKNERGDSVGTISNVRDISMRMEIEEELRQRNRELLILNTIISSLNKFLTIGELLESTLEKVLEIMKIESGALLLLDEEKSSFSIETSKGFSPSFISKISHIDLEENIIGKTVRAGNHFVLEGGKQSKIPFEEWLRSENISSFFCIPIKAKKRVYGMMMCGRRYSRFFSENDVRLLNTIGYQIALSIENVLLYKEVRDSEEKYQHLTETANIGIISFNKEGKIFQFNKKAEDIFGFSREEIINNLATEILPEKHSQLIAKMTEHYMKSGKHKTRGQPLVEYGRGKDGTQMTLEISYSIWGDKLNPIIIATIMEMNL